MRTASEFAVPDVPRWSLWLVAVVCFGPLAGVLFLGVLILPIWIGMLAVLLAEPERFAHDPSVTIWVVVWPIGLVLCRTQSDSSAWSGC